MSEQPSPAPHGLKASEKADETTILSLKYTADGLIPAVVQDVQSQAVLMVAWMNEEALALTLQTGQAHYWSRSRQKLWHKGATSGDFQLLREIRVDCDQDCLLLLIEQTGKGACHTGRTSCFYRRLEEQADGTSRLVFTTAPSTPAA